MAAPPPPPLGPLVAALEKVLAPIHAAIANVQAQQLQQAGALANVQAQLASIQSQLVFDPAAIAAAVAQSLHAAEAVRSLNRRVARGAQYAPVPRADGTLPPSWPAAGFDRAALVEGPVPAVDALLGDYGLPAGAGAGAPAARRVALALALGADLP